MEGRPRTVGEYVDLGRLLADELNRRPAAARAVVHFTPTIDTNPLTPSVR